MDIKSVRNIHWLHMSLLKPGFHSNARNVACVAWKIESILSLRFLAQRPSACILLFFACVIFLRLLRFLRTFYFACVLFLTCVRLNGNRALRGRQSRELSGICLSVSLSVSLSVCTITQKQMIPKCSNSVQRMILAYPTSYMILGSRGQRSRSQGHKVQKGDRVAGVSLHLYRVRSL